jgi:hypothetical protein
MNQSKWRPCFLNTQANTPEFADLWRLTNQYRNHSHWIIRDGESTIHTTSATLSFYLKRICLSKSYEDSRLKLLRKIGIMRNRILFCSEHLLDSHFFTATKIAIITPLPCPDRTRTTHLKYRPILKCGGTLLS